MSKLVCYCFGYTDSDIVGDFKSNKGKSSILEKMTEAKKNNACHCADKNPGKT